MPYRIQQHVQTFHETYGANVGTVPALIAPERVQLRAKLMLEELVDELIPAMERGDIVEVYDAILDLIYVTVGTAVEYGMDIEPGFEEVQRSNMSKLGADGLPLISDGTDGFPLGKVLKGPNFFLPNLTLILQEQGWQPRISFPVEDTAGMAAGCA